MYRLCAIQVFPPSIYLYKFNSKNQMPNINEVQNENLGLMLVNELRLFISI